MAATGGGKIRSRRYHIASKPYAKSKQQQPGLISRVTDTVKSIVPSWLQKYFRNGDAAEGGGNTPEVEQNNQAPPPNGSEEVAPLPHERDSPEPSTSNTEPSTSRASLNFQDVLSRPPLNRTHLHFTSLDASPALGVSSALFSQPSTSSTPFSGAVFAGASSNYSLVKEIKDASSQHEDDNISTTSGFSSRASDKDVLNSKTASLPQLWSPETDRTHSGPQPAQSSLKKPAFNLSVFGTSSTSPMNSSVLNSSQLGDSPFYPGKTTYGGAAAVRSARSRPGTPYQAPVRRQIKVKPAGAQPCGVTSATARRILQSLERMSSPLADAKRIPSTVSSHLSTSLDWSLEFPAKKKRLDTSLPPVQKLVIPAAASVSGNRSMSFRPSLTPGGLGRAVERTLMPRETPKRQSPQIPDAVPGPSQSTSSLPYPLSSTPAASSTGSGGGKMKRERTSARPSSKRPEDEVAELSDLPAISLPISSFSLPTFSFSSPQPTSTVAPTATPMTPVPEEPVANKELPTASTPPCVPFTFSSPIVKATAASPPSFSPSSGFTFSAPVAKTGPSISNGKMATPVVDAVKLSAIESIEEFEGPFKPAKVLKQGSVLDLLKGPGFTSPVARSSPGPDAPQQTPAVSTVAPSSGFGDLFKPPAGSWDCDVCMVQNKASDTKCVACQTAQPNTDSSKLSYSKPTTTSPGLETTTTTTPSSVGFGGLFATPSGTWDCDTCLVQNKPDAIKCVACETAKPGTGVKPSLTLPAFSEAKTLPAATSTTTSISSGFLGFGDKFKKPEGAWECDMCMVENKAQETKCVSCMSPKPGGGAALAEAPPSLAPASTTPLLGFGDKFKKPEGDWDCDVCCVQNKGVNQQCVACQTAKPGAKVEPKAFGSSSFGNQSSSDSGPGGFKFGTASSDSTSESGGFKFGGALSDSSSSAGFKFGASSSDSSSSGGFKFGGASSDAASTDTGSSAGFKFGSSFKFGAASTPAVASASEDSKKAEAPSMGAGFKFGASAGIVFGTGAASMESKPSEGGFSFGLSKPEEKTTAISSTASTFNFPSSQENSEKDSGLSSTDTTSTTTTTTTAAPVFGKLAEPYLATPLGGATFGESLENEQVKPAAPSFTFGKPEEKKEASMPSGFLFTAASKEAESSAPSMGFSFSKPDPPKDQPQPTFAFGKPAEKTETPSETPKPSFNFGQSATDAASAPTPPFGFMASSTSSSTTTTPAPSLFGTPSSSASAPTPAPAPSTFLFGQSSSTEATPAKTFLFGQTQDSQPAPAASLNAAPTPAPSQPFLFGSGTNTPAPSFAFGAAAPSTASSAAPAPSAAPFVFSSASSAGFGTGQAPTFGQGSSQPSTPAFGSPAPSPFSVATSQPPAFGAQPNAAPVFGQQANSTPAFGSSTTTAPGGGFQFGGASAFGASSSGTGMFAFGGSAGGSPAPSVTPSIAPQQSTPGGGFNFTQPPTFNMGAAKSTFTSTPAGPHSSISGRKIKTAVRRRK